MSGGSVRARVGIAWLALLVACQAAAGLAGPAAGSAKPAELPQAYVDTAFPKQTGRTIAVAAAGDFQAALNAAQPGDTITLQAGATYTGPFTVPKKSGAGWIVVRSSATAGLTPAGSRVDPSHTTVMPKLVASRGAVLEVAPAAHHYRFVGVEISPSPNTFLYNLVGIGADVAADEDLPHHLVFDRCYLHGDPANGTRRGIALNGRFLAVVDSHLSDFKEAGADSQALAGWNGPGPFRIVDNYLEGAGENVMFGGADPTVRGLVPSDIEIRGNTFAKNLRWNPRSRTFDGSRWTVKALFELKNARRVLVEGNVFENVWDATALVITPRNQNGAAPWSTVEDVTIRSNVIRRVWSVLVISGYDEYHPSRQTARITFENNVAYGLGEPDLGSSNPKGILLNQGPDDVIIRHNTLLTPPGLGSTYLYLANAQVEKGSSLVFTDNVVGLGAYGFGAENPGAPTVPEALDGHFRSWTFTNNVLIGPGDDASRRYPSGQFWESSVDGVGFVDVAGENLGLNRRSRYKGAGTDRRDIGVDFEALLAVLVRARDSLEPAGALPG